MEGTILTKLYVKGEHLFLGWSSNTLASSPLWTCHIKSDRLTKLAWGPWCNLKYLFLQNRACIPHRRAEDCEEGELSFVDGVVGSVV